MKVKIIKFIFGMLTILVGATLVYATIRGHLWHGDWAWITLATSGIIIVIAGLILASDKSFKEIIDTITNAL